MIREPASPRTPRVIRRIHMYLGLTLMPWVLVYATSTLVMNHRQLFAGGIDENLAVVTDRAYRSELAPDRDLHRWARTILKDLGLEGRHAVEWRESDQALVIHRQIPGRERRITYWPARGRLVVEAAPFRLRRFLTGLHTLHGFGASAAATAWAVLVDAVSAAMIAWALSGLYLWWEMRRTRLWGGLTVAAGALTCAALVAVL
ncbi:MAG TPA: hypothetical protein VNO23_03780 [Candidatus Binatia bacterium]|nr:hypothetical protein [Candidatus Binatia bacterium]